MVYGDNGANDYERKQVDEVINMAGMPKLDIGITPNEIRDKGQQLADLLRPNTFGAYNANPRTLSEWFIYIVAYPIFLPLTWLSQIARWLMVSTRFAVWHILGMIGVKNVQPLMNQICNSLGQGNPLYPLFDMLRNPESEFGAAIIDQAIGGGVAMGIDRVLDPLMRPVGFAIEENLMNQELAMEVYVSGVRKGVISWGNYIQGMRRYGLNPEMASKMYNSLKLAPSIGETLDMLNRRIIDEGTADRYLLMNDYTADINVHLKQLRWYVPPAQDVVRFAVREAYDPSSIAKFGLDQEFPNDAVADAQAAGLSPEKLGLYWRAHWQLPSPQQVYEMLHRGIIDSSVVSQYLKMADYTPYWRGKLQELSFNPFTRVDVRRMFKSGVLNESEVNKAYRDIGYNDEKAAKLTEFTIISQSPTDKLLSLPTIMTGYKDSLISRDAAVNALKAMGYSDYDTNLQLALADYQKRAGLASTVEGLAKAEYKAGTASIESSMELLREYGIPEERIQLLADLWPLEVSHTVKTLTESDLRKAYSVGLISVDGLRAGLVTKNYDTNSIDLIISLENLELSATRLGGIPAGLTTTGAIKLFTKAELKAALVNEIIDPSEWAYQMRLLGYSDEQIQVYANLILVEIAKKAGAS